MGDRSQQSNTTASPLLLKLEVRSLRNNGNKQVEYNKTQIVMVLPSWTKYLSETLVFMSNRVVEEKFNFYFQEFSTSIEKIFNLGGRRSTTLQF